MKNITRVLICITFALFAHTGFSEEEENSENTVDSEDEWQAPKLKTFTKKQIKAECKKYNKKYISYYSKVYYVKNCERHQEKHQKNSNSRSEI